jgi:hypothetical protein
MVRCGRASFPDINVPARNPLIMHGMGLASPGGNSRNRGPRDAYVARQCDRHDHDRFEKGIPALSTNPPFRGLPSQAYRRDDRPARDVSGKTAIGWSPDSVSQMAAK